MNEDARLDRGDFVSAGSNDRVASSPRLACIRAALEVDAPGARSLSRFGAAGTDDHSIRESDGLVLARTKYAVGQASSDRPCPPTVARRSGHLRPALRTRSHFVQQ